MAVASIAVRPLGGTSAVPAVPPEGDQAMRKPTEKIEPLGLPNVDLRHVLRVLNGLPLMVHALRGLRRTNNDTGHRMQTKVGKRRMKSGSTDCKRFVLLIRELGCPSIKHKTSGIAESCC
jgi:hypothetical protein